ncbi:MAG: hypothetical protein A3G25_07260 [Betaproteobacteria bacterium RIFCSPLOWO2_12_FULL_63_13]|nr:MAG: hypothetical protein A3G25_07260 [Betaproteobacteria bacterium RIFCSPLOWO2_12_FULL_63_13]
MNSLQRTVAIVAVINLALMLLFPPHDSLSLWRGGTPTLDGFYFIFERQYNKQTNGDLLTLEILWLFVNAGLAWLLLQNHRPGEGVMSARAAAVVFLVVNLLLVLLFPPFENYATTTRMSGTWFDGFYFAFGDKMHRRFYLPLLYIEVLWVLINGAVMWLLFREPPPPEPEPD